MEDDMGMSQRALVGAALVFGATTTVAFVACRGGGPELPPPQWAPSESPNLPASAASAPSLSASASASALASAAPPSAADQLAAAIAEARRCDEPVTVITNQPDGGIVYNNALTSADAGHIDRGQGVIDELLAHSGAFRCCFDGWLRAHPSDKGRVMLRLALDPEGAVTESGVNAAQSTIDDAVTLGCVVAVARDGTYPKSPVGKTTVVEYPFLVATQ